MELFTFYYIQKGLFIRNKGKENNSDDNNVDIEEDYYS
jgi:hypothetical protein